MSRLFKGLRYLSLSFRKEFKFYKLTKAFVTKAYSGSKLDHFERTVYWIKELKPDYDVALLIAGYSHDIQRRISPVNEGKGFVTGKALKFHQEEGGRIMHKFLLEKGADKIAKRVKELISKHEVGGTNDQNILKDADSLSFLETKIGALKRCLDEGFRKQEVKRKLDWMYNRITVKKAKKIAKPLYESALRELGLV